NVRLQHVNVTLTISYFGQEGSNRVNFISCSEVPPRQYYYVNKALNWSEAQQYCREKYTDLATFDSMDDLNRLKADFSYSWAWIGLHDDPAAWKTSMGNESNSWRWSATGQTSRTGFQSWSINCPDYWKGEETCATITKNGVWNDDLCGFSYSFLCFNGKTKFLDFSEIGSSYYTY
uniref:C-type lectin domain-containing protein n=1 Tax=Oryzias melastigma TaxID=30732 RepID=A0A3B3CQY2_ORYME